MLLLRKGGRVYPLFETPFSCASASAPEKTCIEETLALELDPHVEALEARHQLHGPRPGSCDRAPGRSSQLEIEAQHPIEGAQRAQVKRQEPGLPIAAARHTARRPRRRGSRPARSPGCGRRSARRWRAPGAAPVRPDPRSSRSSAQGARRGARVATASRAKSAKANRRRVSARAPLSGARRSMELEQEAAEGEARGVDAQRREGVDQRRLLEPRHLSRAPAPHRDAQVIEEVQGAREALSRCAAPPWRWR